MRCPGRPRARDPPILLLVWVPSNATIVCGALVMLMAKAWFVILVIAYLWIASAAARVAAIAVVCMVWVLCVGVV